MIPEVKKCVECGAPLNREMERDCGLCVDCQNDRALTLEELEESCADTETLLDETMEAPDETMVDLDLQDLTMKGNK